MRTGNRCTPRAVHHPPLILLLAIVVSAAGCRPRQEPAAPHSDASRPSQPLRVLVVDDPGLAEAVQRQWLARAEGPIQVLETSSAELLAAQSRGLPADAVIYPSGMLGGLVEQGMIAALPDSELNRPQFARRDIFDLLRQREIAWGKQTFAVPLGSPALTLLYRRDLFEALGLNPPETWEQYARLAVRLADRSGLGDLTPAEPQGWSATIEPLAEGWAGQLLLARAAAYARHRSYFSTLFDSQTMEPLIDRPPFVRALEELIAANSPVALACGPAEARREILAGNCAMCISWPSASERSAETAEAAPLLLGFAELPGSRDVYDPGSQRWETRENSDPGQVTLLGVAGRLGSVSSAARQPQAAASLLVNLSSTEWSPHVSPFSPATTLYRDSQISLADSWLGEEFDPASARAYGELLRQALSRPLWLFSPRVPGRERYLEALDLAVRRSVQREILPADALAQAAAAWRSITAELGVDDQRVAYLRSLGLEP